MRTSELKGAALDWAVAKCEDPSWETNEFQLYREWHLENWKPSTDWSQGGPIIEREKIRLDTTWNCEDGYWSARIDSVGGWWQGDTPLIAAMRCFVASKLGDDVEVPDELHRT
jgi:hypothetical protein